MFYFLKDPVMRLWCLYLKHKSKMTKRKGVSKTPIFLISGIRKCGQFLTLPTYVLDPAYLCKYHPVLKTILAKEFWHLICLSGWQSNKWSESSYDLLLHPYSWVWCWVLKGLVELCFSPFLNMQCSWPLRMWFFCLDNFPPACPQPPAYNLPLTLSTAMGKTQFQWELILKVL